MIISATTDLHREVVLAMQAVRLTFQSSGALSDRLNALWGLQDQLHRLVAMADDSPSDVLFVLRGEYPGLISDVTELLAFIAKLRFSELPAVRQCCSVISDSLIELAQLKQQHLAHAARA